MSELKSWDMVHVDLIGTHIKSTIQHHPGGDIIKNNVSIICMAMINPVTDLFEIIEVPTFVLDEVTGGNDEYIDGSSVRIRQLFNSTCLCRYPRPRKVVFDNGFEFKRDFTSFLKYLDVKPVL